MRQVDTILARFPGPVTLHPSRLKILGAFALTLSFAVFCVYLLVAKLPEFDWYDTIMSWLATLFFGVCTARLAVLLQQPGAMSLTLDADGFDIQKIFRRVRTPWQDVGGFRVDESEGFTKGKVMFEVVTAGAGPQRRGAVKVTRALPDYYQLPNDDFACLMEQWRQRARAQET
jgi:hypothetical protein